MSAPQRTPVYGRGGKRISGLYSLALADGGEAYYYVGRLHGSPSVKTVRLKAESKTDAVKEIESLRAGVRERRVAVVADRRVLVRDIVGEYKASLTALAGTEGERSPRTIEDIESKLDLYIVPAIGSLKTASVEAEDIQRLALSAKGRSRSTVLSILSVCSGLFDYCVQNNFANHNPVAAARSKYKGRLLPKASGREQRALTADEIARTMEHVSGSYSPVLTLLIESGIRTSEALGVRWGMVDLEGETLAVVGQLAADGTIRETKTKQRRVIPISKKAATLLRAHKAAQAEAGYDTSDGALAFVSRTGRHLDRRDLLRAWQNALRKTGIEDAGLHSLRHSFISAHALKGTPVVAVSALVGHSDPTVTQKTYTRIAGSGEARVEALREVLA